MGRRVAAELVRPHLAAPLSPEQTMQSPSEQRPTQPRVGVGRYAEAELRPDSADTLLWRLAPQQRVRDHPAP
ncbi:MAG: hypothetical protein RIT45_1011 [Pseudomonadota bacterium]|jgi:hypothetical protein